MITRQPASHRTIRWRRVRLRSERGSTSIEMVILMPVLFGILFLGVQAAMYYYAGTIALAAAQDGARAQAGTDADPDTGTRTATAILAASDGSLENWTATTTISTDTATVTVTGTSLSVIPGWHPTVTKVATAPVERLT